MNAEAYGYRISESNLLYFIRMGLLPNVDSSVVTYYYHPTFLYESLWNLLGFVLLNLFYKKKSYNGQVALCYIAWYGFGRMWIEGLRTDSLYLGDSSIRVSQLVAFLSFAFALTMLVVMWIKGKKEPQKDLFPFLTREKTLIFAEAIAEKAETDRQVNTLNTEESDKAEGASPEEKKE